MTTVFPSWEFDSRAVPNRELDVAQPLGLEPEFEEDVGALIRRRLDAVRRDRPEAACMVEGKCRRERVVGFEPDAVGAFLARPFHSSIDQSAADAAALEALVHGHLSEFAGASLLWIGGPEHGDAADWLAVDRREEDLAAAVDDLVLWVIERGEVFLFDHEVATDPLLVEAAKGGLVTGVEITNDDRAGLFT